MRRQRIDPATHSRLDCRPVILIACNRSPSPAWDQCPFEKAPQSGFAVYRDLACTDAGKGVASSGSRTGIEMVMYHEASRTLQDAFGSRELADRLERHFRRSEDAGFMAAHRRRSRGAAEGWR